MKLVATDSDGVIIGEISFVADTLTSTNATLQCLADKAIAQNETVPDAYAKLAGFTSRYFSLHEVTDPHLISDQLVEWQPKLARVLAAPIWVLLDWFELTKGDREWRQRLSDNWRVGGCRGESKRFFRSI
jgi:hypothetical protein